MSNKLWRAIELLTLFKAFGRYESHEDDFVNTMFQNANPDDPAEGMTEKQITFLKHLYKKYILVEWN